MNGTLPASLVATDSAPVTIYYCKAGLPTGTTVRVLHGRRKIECAGVRLSDASAEMIHGNSSGPAKASGARCVLVVTAGTVELILPPG